MADQEPGTLSITVYRINPTTRQKTIIKPKRVVEAGDPLLTFGFPPCQCHRCLKENRSR